MKRIVVDTSVLMEGEEELLERLLEMYEVNIPLKVLDELDNLKDAYKNKYKSIKARRAIKFIDRNYDKVKFGTCEEEIEDTKGDNVIIDLAVKRKANLITFDVGMSVRARQRGVTVITEIAGESIRDNIDNYKGYKVLEIDCLSDEDQLIMDRIYKNEDVIGMCINEYLIIRHKDDKSTIDIRRWNGTEFVKLISNMNTQIDPANDLQKCALDLLLNPEILVKGVFGDAGCGKTYLAVKSGIYQLKKTEEYKKILLVRNPVGPGEDIGYLQGDKNGKIGDFFKPVIQHLDNGKVEAEDMQQKGTLELEIPKFMKGLDIQDTYIIVDEAEDLDSKLIKLLGTRVSKGSSIIFTGDYSQSERRYQVNNGIKELIQRSSGNKIFGYIVLEEDLRSDASKMFAELF